jgi:hypothetical protein
VSALRDLVRETLVQQACDHAAATSDYSHHPLRSLVHVQCPTCGVKASWDAAGIAYRVWPGVRSTRPTARDIARYVSPRILARRAAPMPKAA